MIVYIVCVQVDGRYSLFRTTEIRINIADNGKMIDYNYLSIRDRYIEAFLIGLKVYLGSRYGIGDDVLFEDRYVLERYRTSHRCSSIEELLGSVSVDIVASYIDIKPYLDEFLERFHNTDKINLYHLTINSEYELVITNKWLKRAYRNERQNINIGARKVRHLLPRGY